MAGLLILKQMHNLSDEALCERWVQNRFQFFCGEVVFRPGSDCRRPTINTNGPSGKPGKLPPYTSKSGFIRGIPVLEEWPKSILRLLLLLLLTHWRPADVDSTPCDVQSSRMAQHQHLKAHYSGVAIVGGVGYVHKKTGFFRGNLR
jgi:hypothetical protein